MNSIPPTIGRAVWVWRPSDLNVLDARQPFDGRICFVHPDGRVGVRFVDHYGFAEGAACIELRDPQLQPNPLRPLPAAPHGVYDAHGVEPCDYATWMPFQMGQAKKGAGS